MLTHALQRKDMATPFSAPLFGEVATALAAYFEGLHNSDATRLAELCARNIFLVVQSVDVVVSYICRL